MAHRHRLHNQRPFDIAEIKTSLQAVQGHGGGPTRVVQKVVKAPSVTEVPPVPNGIDPSEVYDDTIGRRLAIGRAVLNAPSFVSLKPRNPKAASLEFAPHTDGMRVIYVPEEEMEELGPAAVWWLRDRVNTRRAKAAELQSSTTIPITRLLWRSDPDDKYATNVYATFSLDAGRPLNQERYNLRKGVADVNRPAVMCLLGVVVGNVSGTQAIDGEVRYMVKNGLEDYLRGDQAEPLLQLGPVGLLEPNSID